MEQACKIPHERDAEKLKELYEEIDHDAAKRLGVEIIELEVTDKEGDYEEVEETQNTDAAPSPLEQ